MLHITKQVMGIEPTYPAWKAGVLAFILYLHIKFTYDFYELYNSYIPPDDGDVTSSKSTIKSI